MVKKITLLLAGMLAVAVPAISSADYLGRHPAYLHALSDLRAARWLIYQKADHGGPGGQAEVFAIQEMDAALREIVHAAYRDGKDPGDQPPPQDGGDFGGKLHRAMDLLREARSDVARPEDDPAAIGLRDRSVQHIEAALHAVEQARIDGRYR